MSASQVLQHSLQGLGQTAAHDYRIECPVTFEQELAAAVEQFNIDNATRTPLINALDKCKQYAIQQVAYKSKASWVQYVREQLSLGGSKLFRHIASEEKAFLNVSLTDYPQYDNSPQAFLKDQAADWSKYWSAESQQASTKAAFKHLRYQAQAQIGRAHV